MASRSSQVGLPASARVAGGRHYRRQLWGIEYTARTIRNRDSHGAQSVTDRRHNHTQGSLELVQTTVIL